MLQVRPMLLVVLASLGAFGEPPEIVLSGINRGANTGRAVLHSGTVGAALTAANYDARALAVSLDVIAPGEVGSGGAAFSVTEDARLYWSTAAEVAADLLEDWLADAEPGTVGNLNVPDRPVADLAGLRRAELAAFGQVRMAIADHGTDFARITLEQGEPAAEGTDVRLLGEGYATFTVLEPIRAAAHVAIPAQRAPRVRRLR
ncbi:5'/3'-nucleotidase SurE [Actinoplanes sp. CA-142083]|uniref:5'/3'-nucleotidase SurE n=1 Tax=Actinoplanes sp. CA-142083 TaxID=3239903 RepID=UPI003D8EEB83